MTKQYRAEFRVLDPGRRPKTKWLLYPSAKELMERFLLAEDELCLVDSADTIDKMLLQQKGVDTFVRGSDQIYVMNDLATIAKDLKMQTRELPIHMSQSVEIRLVEHDNEKDLKEISDQWSQLKKKKHGKERT